MAREMLFSGEETGELLIYADAERDQRYPLERAHLIDGGRRFELLTTYKSRKYATGRRHT